MVLICADQNTPGTDYFEITINDDDQFILRSAGAYKDLKFTPEQLEQCYRDAVLKGEGDPKDFVDEWIREHNITTENAKPEMPEDATENDFTLRACEGLQHFLRGFELDASPRMVNTLVSILFKGGNEEARTYVLNYLKLSGNQFVKDAEGKLKTPEFDNILELFSKGRKPTKTINQRLAVFFGPQGGGKTTLAMKLAGEGAPVIVCKNDMTCDDLFNIFTFNDGKPSYEKSDILRCMTEGTTLVLDEMNLLSFSVLKTLQGMCDGKSYITDKGKNIPIADGFKIIGTMNLKTDGIEYPLPTPLVDRCSDIREMLPTAEFLASCI